ncbi:MAG: AmmeMemoRadiSam system protein B [Candidatus Omnitrophica bacterium]|nr:AmmeMemoRadiSam system protein B [Candidatus Omnitrophota bacterium]
MKKILIGLITSTLLAGTAMGEVKKADLAGRWYSASKRSLTAELQSYLTKATPPSIDGEIVAIISPHAGFVYSGPVAAYGFKAISKQTIKTVVVVGFSHTRNYDGIAVLDVDGIETPLGVVEIDKKITEQLIAAHPKIYDKPLAFLGENSIEMEIPFLQAVLNDFKIVLVAIGDQNLENCKILGKALYDTLKDKESFLLVASTDMSHYLPYKKANSMDRKTISVIEEFDADKLYTESSLSGHQLMCGYGAVYATMIATKKLGADKIEILKYANSGDTTWDKRRVVGYLSAAIIKSNISASGGKNLRQRRIRLGRKKSKLGPKRQMPKSEKGDNDMLNEVQRKKMLKLARDSIMHYLKNRKRLPVEETDPVLLAEMGGFVTLHKHGQLRGCIGNIVGRGPFYLTVRDMAVEAATGDPRFPQVTLNEMDDIDIEISALSPLKKIDNPDVIEMGKHGVIVRRGFTSGVYLPQVATEAGWNREQFMNSLCGDKAGMSPDAWKKGECDIYIFTAEVFGEKEE